MTSELSSAPTLAPSDSASRVETDSRPTAPSKGKGPRQGNKPNPKKPQTPPGAVEVPPPGEKKSNKKSPVVSGTIPISGWGEIDLHDFRRDIRPVFTVDATPYQDLVDHTYVAMMGKYSQASKHIPRALFTYYCFQLWWMRVLWLHRANSNVLTTDERQALQVLTSGEEFMVPSPIAQYLANLGNFQQGGETYYFDKLSIPFTGEWDDGNVEKGWIPTTAGIRVQDGASFYAYAQVPVPGVFTQAAQIEANSTLPFPAARQTLDHIQPQFDGTTTIATRNILGYSPVDTIAQHSSWRSAYSLLGWSNDTLPPDTQTVFNISVSTMKWVSERLSTVRDLKLHSSNQLVLSTMGNPIQAYFLATDVPASQMPHYQYAAPFVDTWRGADHSELALFSRYGMDSKMLAPAFSFGYRLRRSLIFRRYQQGQPQYFDRTNFDPWVFFDATNAPSPLPGGWSNFRDVPFTHGSQAFINVPRFSTPELSRSVGLDSAIAL